MISDLSIKQSLFRIVCALFDDTAPNLEYHKKLNKTNPFNFSRYVIIFLFPSLKRIVYWNKQ